MNEIPFDEVISQPLLDSDGRLNPACINELPPTYLRLQDNDEWNTPEWTFWREIVGFLAQWACRQSPYGCPDNLESVCKYLAACLKRDKRFDTLGMGKVNLCEINQLLHEILLDVPEFLAWNRCKKCKTPEIQFVTAYDGSRDPDYDFIDLDALMHNVCVSIRDERRQHKADDAAFEQYIKETDVKQSTTPQS